MTSEEKQEIINAVLAALRTNSKTISQLTPVSSLSDDDSIEIGGGKRVTYAVLKSLFEVLYSTAIENGIDANNEIFFSGSKLKMSAVPDELNAALNEYFEACVRQDSDNLVDLLYSRIVLLDSMGSELDGLSYTPVAGDLVWRNGYVFRWNGTAWEDGAVQPRKHVEYINKHTGKRYMWTGTAMQELEGTSSVHVVNNLTTGGEGDALSAEQGKRLKGKIDEVQANVVNLYNRLANIAFPTAADKAAAEPTELDWSIPKVAVTITNSIGANIAVIKRNGQAVSGSVMVEQGDSLTLTIEGTGSYGLTSVFAAIDGGTATPLTGVNGVFTLNVVQVNAAMSIVITGTYSQTVGITYNLSHCTKTSGPTSVVTGGTATIEITADAGYTLQSVTPTVTGATIDSWTLNAGVGTLVISNVTGAVVVSATAAQAGQVSVTKTIGRGEGTITGNDSVTAGSTYSCAIAPAADWGLKAANVKVLIDGVEAAASDYTLTIDSSYNGSLSIPTSANLQSLEVVVEFAVKLYSGKYIANTGSFLDKVGSSTYTPCSLKAYIPLPDTFTPAAGDTFNWCYMFPAGTYFSNNSEPVYLVFYDDGHTKKTNWSANTNNVRSATFTATVVGSKSWRASFNVDEIVNCYLKYTPSGKSEITLFDGSDTDSYIIV